MMRSLLTFAAVSLFAVAASAQTTAADPHQWKMTADETPIHISEHVWAVRGNPNVAIIVGSRSAMVVDTGLGPHYGEIAAGFAQKLAPGKHLFLTTTHFHPEHVAGEQAFPPDTILIRNDVQEMEMENFGMGMIKQFADRSAENGELLKNITLRTPDVTFHDEAKVDLGGGVIVRLMWLGGAHTEGDELTFVEPDATLISGDVVQNATMPSIYTGLGKGGTPTTWLQVVDKLAALHPAHVIPDHSEPGDGSLVTQEQQLISEIRTSAIADKKRGLTADQAGTEISAKLKQEHPTWLQTNAAGFVKSVYADPDTSAQ